MTHEDEWKPKDEHLRVRVDEALKIAHRYGGEDGPDTYDWNEGIAP